MDDCNLEKLSIKPGKLSPAFKQDVLEYSTTVQSSVEKVSLDTLTRDSGASYTISVCIDFVIGFRDILSVQVQAFPKILHSLDALFSVHDHVYSSGIKQRPKKTQAAIIQWAFVIDSQVSISPNHHENVSV